MKDNKLGQLEKNSPLFELRGAFKIENYMLIFYILYLVYNYLKLLILCLLVALDKINELQSQMWNVGYIMTQAEPCG